MTPVRVRIAPSPTGEPHVGTAYTALFNVLLARRLGGEMILRIEDTDQTRSTPDSEQKVMEALRWLGLHWSEGPDKGGPHAPYRQSERRHIYPQYVDKLLHDGHAFKCFCTRERLDVMREEQRRRGEQPKYDGLCLHLTPEEVSAKEAEGIPHVVRMKVPETGECTFEDGVYGTVSIPWASVDMQVLMKADGMPTYHMANVVDDHLMKITHVARGEEWMSSVPKHLLLYRYLGFEPPQFMHLPLLRNPDRTKLSKRRNPTSISYFSSVGYLPEALLNLMGLGFVSIAEGDEVMTLDELAAAFDPGSMAKGGAVFDLQKLDYLNGRWLREKLDEDGFRARLLDWAMMNNRLAGGLELARTRIARLGDLPDLVSFLFRSDLNLTRADFEATKNGAEDSAVVLKAILAMVDTLPEWSREAIEEEVRRIADGMGRKLRVVIPPIFVAMSGSTRSLPLFDSMALLGRSIVRQRLKMALAVLPDAP
ncbi:glutamate--tRNA ligase [Indioceanicola profundi]|uniref:glutamate--tRNA ligase n=1 Tax=Indioceanicola profundi TaxID=2220096 RepID=UPI000E6A9BAE|nr:glutamate--tRNA ligase [Indioceanicola profundi]